MLRRHHFHVYLRFESHGFTDSLTKFTYTFAIGARTNASISLIDVLDARKPEGGSRRARSEETHFRIFKPVRLFSTLTSSRRHLNVVANGSVRRERAKFRWRKRKTHEISRYFDVTFHLSTTLSRIHCL